MFELRGVLKREKELEQKSESEITAQERQEQSQQIEQSFTNFLQKLVNVSIKNTTRVSLSHIKDIFNAVSQRLERAVKSQERELEVLYIKVLGVIVGKYYGQDKVDTYEMLNMILDQEEEFDVCILLMKVVQNLSPKRSEHSDKLALFARAHNLLLSKENEKTLLQMVQLNHASLSLDFESDFELDNERSITYKPALVHYPAEEVYSSELSSRELAKLIAAKNDRENHVGFIEKLQIKILWLKHMRKHHTASKYMAAYFEAIYFGCNSLGQSRTAGLETFMKDEFSKQCMEVLKFCSDPDIVYQTAQCMNQVYVKMQGQTVTIDILVKPSDQLSFLRENEDTPQKAAITYIIEDLASFQLIKETQPVDSSLVSSTETISVRPTASTKVISGLAIVDEDIQLQLSGLAYNVIRVIMAQHRGSQAFQDLVSSTFAHMLRYFTDEPEDYLYNFNPLVSYQVIQIMKGIIRPRLEEQHDIIAKIEKRLLFELENIDKDFYTWCNQTGTKKLVDQRDRQHIVRNLILILSELAQRDQGQAGITQKILGSKIIPAIVDFLKYNNDEQGDLVDDILGKVFTFIGALCGDSPASIPTLIRNRVIPEIVESFEKRCPLAGETLEQSMYGVNQISIHQEGQDYIASRNFFKLILERAIDDKYAPYMVQEQMLLRVYMSSIFDKVPLFLQQAKEIHAVVLDKLEEFAREQAVEYLKIYRREDLTPEQKARETMRLGGVGNSPAIVASINIIYCFSLLSSDNMGPNRYTQELIPEPTFKRIVDKIYMQMMMVPHLEEFQSYFEKIFKHIIEPNNFPTNLTHLIEAMAFQSTRLNDVLGKPIYEFEEIDLSPAKPEDNLKPIDELKLESLEEYLSRGEQSLFQICKIMPMLKVAFSFHTNTIQTLAQNKNILKVTKMVYYLRRIFHNQKVNYFMNQVLKLREMPQPENQEMEQAEKQQPTQQQQAEQLKELLFTKFDLNGQNVRQRREDMAKIKNFMYNDLNKSFQRDTVYKINDKALVEFVNKLQSASFYVRNPAQKEALDKNLFLVGKMVYKKVKQLRKSRLSEELIHPESIELQKSLFEISLTLFDLTQNIKSSWLDGGSFYIFLKKGGVEELMNVFWWLSERCLPLIGAGYPQLTVFLFDEACTHLHTVLRHLLATRSTDNNNQSILNTDFGSDFDNAKNLYQSFFSQVCTKLARTDLADKPGEENLITKLSHPRQHSLQDVLLTLLKYSLKSFSQCQILQSDMRNQRRDDGRGGRNRAEQRFVDEIFGMGFGFPRERIQQALIQSNNDMNNALNVLFEQQIEARSGLNQRSNRRVVEEDISSGQSEDDGDQQMNEDPYVQLKEPKVRVPKVEQKDYEATVAATQKLGFKWIAQIFEQLQEKGAKDWSSQYQLSPRTVTDFKEYLLVYIMNEKVEDKIRPLYAAIDRIFKLCLENLKTQLLELSAQAVPPKKELKASQGEDQDMREVSSNSEEGKANEEIQELFRQEGGGQMFEIFQGIIEWFIIDLNLVSSLVTNSKGCLKESVINSSSFLKAHELLVLLLKHFEDENFQKAYLSTRSDEEHYQKLILEVIQFQFIVVQMSQLSVARYRQSKYPQPQGEAKASQFLRRVPLEQTHKLFKDLLKQHQQQLENKARVIYKQAIVTSAAIMCLKIMNSTGSVPGLTREEVQQETFDIFNLLTSGKHQLSSGAERSMVLQFLEDSKLMSPQFEKMATRLLFVKYEFQTYKSQQREKARPEKEKAEDMEPHLKSKAGFNNFLKYTQEFHKRDAALFESIVKENFSISTVKVAGSVSQDQAQIHIKQAKFAEIKKQVAKERGQLKQLVKTLDLKNEKSVKALIKQSKKALGATVNDHYSKSFNQMISKIAGATSRKLEEFVEFKKLQTQGKKLLIPLSQASEDANMYMDQIHTLSVICLAYPQVTALLLDAHPQPKRSFANWFIKDYLTCQILKRTEKPTNALPQPEDAEMEMGGVLSQKPEAPIKMLEVTFKESDTLIEDLQRKLVVLVNDLTSYHHLMGIQEIAVKHQLRFKFMVEALSILQRSIKDKQIHPILQKAQIFTAILTIESLVNYQDQYLKGKHVFAKDNFINSLRLAIFRDASLKDLPPSLIKLIDDLLGDGTPSNPGPVDVTQDHNKFIIQKLVSILNLLADFVNEEKKREEKNALKRGEMRVVSQQSEERKDEGARRLSWGGQRSESMGSLELLPNVGVVGEEQPIADEFNQRPYGLDEEEEGFNQGVGDDSSSSEVEQEQNHPHGRELDDDDEDEDEEGDMEDDDDGGEDIYEEEAEEELARHIGRIDRHNAFAMFEDDLVDEEEEDDDEMVEEPDGWPGNDWQQEDHRRFGPDGLQDITNPINLQNPDNERVLAYGAIAQNPAGGNHFSEVWTQEEASVQRILTYLRVNTNPMGQRLVAQLGPGDRRNDRDPNYQPDLMAQRQQPNGSIIDQMYQELKPISEDRFTEMMNAQRAAFEKECNQGVRARLQELIFSDERRDRIQENLNNLIPPPILQRNPVIGGVIGNRRQDEIMIEIEPFGLPEEDLGGAWQVHRLNNLDFLQIGGGLGFADPELDPMFMRPPGFDAGRRGVGGRIPPRGAYIDREALGGGGIFGEHSLHWNQLLVNLQGLSQQIQTESRADFGNRMMTSMEVNVEEVKEPEQQPASAQQPGASGLNAQELSNDLLLSSFFGGERRPSRDDQGLNNPSRTPDQSPRPRRRSVGRQEPPQLSEAFMIPPLPRMANMGFDNPMMPPPFPGQIPQPPSMQSFMQQFQNQIREPSQPAAENQSLSSLQNEARELMEEQARLQNQQREMNEFMLHQQRDLQQLIQMASSGMPAREILQQAAHMQPDIEPVQEQINQISIYDNPFPNANQNASEQVQDQAENQEEQKQEENKNNGVEIVQQQQEQQVAQADQVMEEVVEQRVFYDPALALGEAQQPIQEALVQSSNQASAQVEALVQEEEKKEEEKAEEAASEGQVQVPAAEEFTGGYSNEILLAYGIDPDILKEIPEELIDEFLADFEIPQEYRNRSNRVQEQQQPPVQSQPVPAQASNEEQKASEQPAAENQQQQNAQPAAAQSQAHSLAAELGLDPEFIANLPAEMVLELINDEQFRNRNLGGASQAQPSAPQRQPEQMDVASFIATVVDPGLRREIFANMDEATVATLPPNLMAEARRVHDHIRHERQRREQQQQNRDPMEFLNRARNMAEQLRRMGGAAGGENQQELDRFSNHMMNRFRNRDEEHKRQNRQQNRGQYGFAGRQPGEPAPSNGEERLEDVVAKWQDILFEEHLLNNEDFVQVLVQQLSHDEKILEQLLLVLMTNQSVECGLLPCISNLIKILSCGQPVIRNKVMNAITFLLKSFSQSDNEALRAIYADQAQKINQKRAALILIGCLRLLLKSNKALMKWMLKGLFQKEEQPQPNPSAVLASNNSSVSIQKPQKQNHILRKQAKHIQSKSSTQQQQQPLSERQNSEQPELPMEVTSSLQATQSHPVPTSTALISEGEQINTSSTNLAVQPVLRLVQIQGTPALSDIFSLIKSPQFKQDKTLGRNLNYLIQQLLKQFDIVLAEFNNNRCTISSETVQALAEVLSLENISQNMMSDLGKFLYKISELDKANFDLITNYCAVYSKELVGELKERLGRLVSSFEDMRARISPTKVKFSSAEEEGLPNYSPSMFESQRQDSLYEEEKGDAMVIDTTVNPMAEKQTSILSIKLTDDEEKQLRELLKANEKYEMLLRIFKLFNLFYENYSEKLEKKGGADAQIESMLEMVRGVYGEGLMSEFVRVVSRVMRIMMVANVEAFDSLSLLLFCVFSQYYPDMVASLSHEKEQAQKLQAPGSDGEARKQNTKYQIKFLTMEESSVTQHNYIIFKNQKYFTNRVAEISRFCRVNKRIINQLIKKRPAFASGEIEGLIRNMPDLLDFDNKRIYFKKELAAIRRHQMFNGMHLNIRRDEILMDAFHQINQLSAEEMRQKMNIQFSGERGQDAGGLTRDFFIELSRQMFNPMYSLFILSSNGSTYYPNPKSSIQVDHLRFFKFIGRVVAKALMEECLLECYFVKSFYKMMTGEPLIVQDMEDFDNELYNNLKWCVTNDITALQTTFVAQVDNFGKMQDHELIENGAKVEVNNDNKHVFIEKMVEFRLYKSIQQQVDAFLEGFYELMPKPLISLFNHKELELLISGLPNFDLADLKKNTEFAGYKANSPQVMWLWEILETFDNEDRAQFLQFVTGSSKVPIDGFKGLIGMRGPQKFTVAKIKTDDILRLPSGHTCFNQIDIPEYPSKEIMHERLLTAVKETRGFGFA